MTKTSSRHPKIQYWSFNEADIRSSQYKEVIDRIKENGCFNMLCASSWTINLWDISNKPLIRELAEYAHARGIRVPLQVFPKGFKVRTGVGVEDAAALVTEYECMADENPVIIRAVGQHVRHAHICSSLKSELLRAYAFRKCAAGKYEAGSLIDITGRAQIIYQDPESLTLSFNTEDLNGCCIYVMVAHYYGCIDLFSDVSIQEYKALIDAYADVPLSGIVLDEYKNMSIMPPWLIDQFCERFYGKNFHRYFAEQTGNDLIQTLFEMRFCPENQDDVRIRAINQYFDIYRHSTKRVETFVAEYSEKVFGEGSFPGLHNTYHNHLQSDEIWETCCNWWEVPRKYAQTDEDITYPIRMGMACGCRENLVYDMYYSPKREKYIEKAVRDARFGSRIHYHIIRSAGDSDISLDTGNPEFLKAIKPYEDKIELINRFDPAMPDMKLLVIFGFPALCNWYPDFEARNPMGINGKLNIHDRVKALWDDGYLNALAPSDALADGRITMKEGYFDYCGHRFEKMLYLYPQYSKKDVLTFLQNAVDQGYDLKIIGDLTWDFEGNPAGITFGPDVMLTEDSDIAAQMHLTPNPIPDGAMLEDGSVVITNEESIAQDQFCTYRFGVGKFECEATFRGVLAVKLRENGSIEKMAAGNLKEFFVDGKRVLHFDGEQDYVTEGR